tara:strand:+ start:2151 stop:4235 length:2085 start_codon:yes stop_codon:yes gene_type:complete
MGNALVTQADIQLKNRDGVYGSAPLSVLPFINLTYGQGYIVADGNKAFFRRAQVGQNYSATIDLYNIGFAPQNIDSIGTPGAFTITPSQSIPTSLDPGQKLTLTIDYSPASLSPSLIKEEIEIVTGFRNFKILLGATVTDGPAATINITSDSGTLVELNQENTDYVLQTDLDINGSAFIVTADNITLDLNGYNVTYGSATTETNCGISCMPDYRANTITNLSGKGGGSSHGFMLTGENSQLIQRASMAAYGHCIYVWSHSGDFHTYEKVTLMPSSDSAHAVYGHYAGDGFFLNQGLSVDSSVSVIQSRHSYHGYMIKLSASEKFWSIEGVALSGGAQGGIVGPDSLYLQVTNCNVSHQASYANGFGIYGGKFSDVWNNVIPATANGRGLRVEDDSFGWNNIVDIKEGLQSIEYGYSDSYGLQIEKETGTDAERIRYFSNILVSRAFAGGKGCAAIKCTAVGSANNSRIHDNIVAAYRHDTATTPAAAISIVQAATNPGASPLLTNNTYFIDELLVYSFWDGVSNLDIRNSTVGLGPNPENAGDTKRSLALAYFEIGASRPYNSINNKIINTTIDPAISKASINIKDNPSTDASLSYGWSYSLTVTTDGVEPIAGASVVIADGDLTQVFNGITDASGKISLDLNEHLTAALAAGAATKTDVSLHNVTVTAAGYVQQNFTVDAIQSRNETIIMVAS